MKLNIVDKGHSNVMNGADIPHGTVFIGDLDGVTGLYIKYSYRYYAPSITIISAGGHISGAALANPGAYHFTDYKVVEELTAVVK